MAASDTQTKVLEVIVDNNKAITSIAEYNRLIDEQKQKQQKLAEEVKKGNISQADYQKALAQSKEEVKTYSRSVQELSKEVQNNIKQSQEQDGSLRSLRAQLSNLTKEFDALSRAEREGDAGKAKMDEINRITNEIKGAEEQTQRYYRNVGNYGGAIMDAFSKTGGAVGAVINPVKNVTAGFKALSATPLIAILGVLANVINLIIEKLNSSEASMIKVKAALAPLTAGGTLLTKIFQKLGEGVVWLAEKLGKMAEKLGLVSDAMKEEQRLAMEEIDLTQKRRAALTENADAELKIAQLMEKATDKINYTHAERLKFLKAASAEEEAVAKRNMEIARQEYKILEDRSKLAENSAEENQKLAEAYAKMIQQETEYFKKKKELNAQITEATNQANAERKAALKAELDAVREATNKRIELMKDGLDKEKATEEANHAKTIADLQNRLATEKNLTAKAREAINTQIELENQRHQKQMEALDVEALTKKIETEQKNIELRLAAVKQGTDAEYQLKLEALQKTMELELQNTELTEEQKKLIREKYNAEREQMENDWANASMQKALDQMRLEYENKINEAALQGQNTLQLQLEMKRAELDALQQLEGESDAEFKARQLEAQKAYLDAKNALNAYEIQIETAKFKALNSMLSGVTEMLEVVGEENEKAAKAAKILALAQMAIQQGVAVANAIRTATQSSATWIDMLVAIATSVGAVTAVTSSAIAAVRSVKLATGGYVSGPGTGTSDSIPAQLSNGESVINARSTAMFGPLLSSLNQAGGGIAFNPAAGGSREGYEFLASAVAAGMKSVNLHVGIDEVTQVQDRVATINEISTIG